MPDPSLPHPSLLDELLQVALTATHSLPAGLLARRRTRIDIETKSSTSDLVTDSDAWCEAQLVDALLAARPDDGILGEEGANRTGSSGVRWIIDPIDGTTNFVHDIPGFSISVAAEVDGVVSVGLVRDPVRAETFSALLGQGAERNGATISTSTKTALDQSLIGTGFNYQADLRAVQAEQLLSVLPVVRDIRRLGGAALDLCAVACGRLDGFYEAGLQPWDIAAGGLIATEAGALLTDFAGQPATDGRVVCAGPGIHQQLCNLIDH